MANKTLPDVIQDGSIISLLWSRSSIVRMRGAGYHPYKMDKYGMEECIAMGDRPVPLRSNRLEVRLVVPTLFFFDKPIEISEAIFQFGLQSLEGIRQLFTTVLVDMCAPLRFA